MKNMRHYLGPNRFNVSEYTTNDNQIHSIITGKRIADETVGIKLPVIKNGNQEQPMYAHTACMINDQLSIEVIGSIEVYQYRETSGPDGTKTSNHRIINKKKDM